MRALACAWTFMTSVSCGQRLHVALPPSQGYVRRLHVIASFLSAFSPTAALHPATPMLSSLGSNPTLRSLSQNNPVLLQPGPLPRCLSGTASATCRSKAGVPRTVLLATEKAFAKQAVDKIENILRDAKYTLKKLESYTSKAELLDAVADVDAMIIRSDIVDREVLERATKMQLVVRAGAGYDNIDLRACRDKDVVAMNTPGQNANAVAELVFAMMLVSARSNFDGTSGFELVNRAIGFYGFGAVAKAVHKLAQAFGMKSYAYAPSISAEQVRKAGATPVDTLADLFKQQYVSLHVPLTGSTRESVNKALLSAMPQGGTLINTARAEIVDEDDLLEVLKERPDFCYLCDVMPKKIEEIKEAAGDRLMKRVIFTKKKMGAQTIEANNNAGVAAANQIVSFFEKGDVTCQVRE